MNNVARRGTMKGAADKLRVLLARWRKGVDGTRLMRDADVWAMESPEDIAAKLKAEADAKAKADKDAQDAATYSIDELYRRILKVEKLSKKVRDINDLNNVNRKMSKVSDL